jgi:hypothetical protein
MSFGKGFIFKAEYFEKNSETENSFGEDESDFEILSILGNGSYGRVTCVKQIQTGKRYFKKEFLRSNQLNF